MNSGTVIGIIEKNKRNRIVVERCEYEGHPYLDIRIHFKPEGKEEWLPTKKAVTVGVKALEELIRVLETSRTHLNPTPREGENDT